MDMVSILGHSQRPEPRAEWERGSMRLGRSVVSAHTLVRFAAVKDIGVVWPVPGTFVA